jgi:hypothetical protein
MTVTMAPPPPQTSNVATEAAAPIGRGRSAVVYLDAAHSPRPVVRKVFTGDGPSRAVLYVLTGGGNPYGWSPAAMRCAVVRRRILARLVPLWFGDHLRLPETMGWSWDDDARAHVLRTEFIDGRHLPLRGPVEDDAPGVLLDDLQRRIMRPLQRHLVEAGFDGLVWQAGRGNPVAVSNFMLDARERDDDGQPRWVWIDLESGVPALFALNPLATLRYYLPKSAKHRRWLFDDVDVPRLRAYIESKRDELIDRRGYDDWTALAADVDELDEQQQAWRSLRRHERGILSERVRGRLTKQQATWYQARPLRWAARMMGLGIASGARLVGGLAGRAWDFLHWRVLPRASCGATFARTRPART